VKPRWIIDDTGNAHYFRRWAEDIMVVTWCGLTLKPLFATEPKAGRECRICTDDTRQEREQAAA
jgi:hypothetical protein